MILVDANLLVYAHNQSFSRHRAARDWLDAQLNGASRVGLPWPSLLAFLRLVTNPRIFPRPLSVADAWLQIENWLTAPNVWIPHPGDQHATILAGIIRAISPSGNLVPDAHLAALAIEHGLTLCSADADFARFQGLRWVDPLRA